MMPSMKLLNKDPRSQPVTLHLPRDSNTIVIHYVPCFNPESSSSKISKFISYFEIISNFLAN